MADNDSTVRRTLHFKFVLPNADPAQLASLSQALAPFYGMFGGKSVQLLQNVDDPGKFIQVIEYDTPAAAELNRQRIAGDPRMQAYLQTWRAFAPGGVELDVYRDVTT